MKKIPVLALSLLFAAAPAPAAEIVELDAVEVRASREDMLGRAAAASEGIVSFQRLQNRPMERPAEVLETVPGMIVTQHSGSGKANQYFMRGFNLDHGTDFAVSLLGMPLNFRSHAHGQGYLDLNFLIPELVDRIEYRKGPYRADDGDFSAAGSARIEYKRQLDATLASISVGQDGYRRTLLAGSPAFANGNLLYALEWNGNDGPWTNPEDYKRINGVLRYSQGSEANGWSLSALSYRSRWNSTDQVPQRAIDQGLISRFGSIDSTDGGSTARSIATGHWARSGEDSASRASLYWSRYRLNLFSNFSYFTDPVNGDQFEQSDRRNTYGFAASHTIYDKLSGLPSETRFGIESRRDRISPVGLYLTTARARHATIRQDSIDEDSFGIHIENTLRWTERLRSIIGLRADAYRFDVTSDTAANSGRSSDRIASPKFSLIYAATPKTEIYGNLGYGFHSNDARGVTTRVNPDSRDPAFGTAVDPVTPLVRAKGSELGLRAQPLPGWASAIALWQLDIDSELLFIGDAGTTEPSRPSRRRGLEWSNMWTPARGWVVDADFAWAKARFTDTDPAGDRIPGAISRTASIGLGMHGKTDRFAELRLRYFGPRPLVEDHSVRSSSSTIINLKLGWRPERRLLLSLDVINLFDRKVSDIDYFYDSQLRSEATPVADVHTHPAIPRTLRLTLRTDF